MTEYPLLIKKALGAGLPTDDRSPRNGTFMKTMENAIPRQRDGATYAASPEIITNPTGRSFATWPAEQLIRGEGVTLACAATGLRSVASDWSTAVIHVYDAQNAASEQSITAGGAWRGAFFDKSYVLANGANVVFSLPSNASGKVLRADPAIFNARAVASYQGGLAVGGCSGSWFSGQRWLDLFAAYRETQGNEQYGDEAQAFDQRWVVCAQPQGGAVDIPQYMLLCALGVFGNAKFDELRGEIYTAFENRAIWMQPIRRTGSVQAMQPISDRLAVFCTDGASELYRSRDNLFFIEEPQSDLGIISRAAVNGDHRTHYAFLSPTGFLFLRTMQEGVKVLDFHTRLSSMTDKTVISYDAGQQEWYIADENTCYILTKEGALGGPVTVRPTNLFYDPAYGLVGIAANQGSDITMRLRSNTFDNNSRGSKRIPTVAVDQRNIVGASVRIDWSVDIEGTGSLNPGRTVPVNRNGVAFPGQSYVDAELYYEGPVASGRTGVVSSIQERYHAQDRRFDRGPSGANTETE